ncbi:HNH endonuclease, partial [Mycobacterium angelicum]|nr:HNH endonuclease [Mycobacterium angelicum]
AGVDLFGQMRKPPCAPPTPDRRSRSAERASRITRARKHNREQRPINEYERWLARARERELADRRFRNHMRDMLFAFKRAPSTSPFCRWVNDPREPEELPPDWTPDEPMPEPLPDDPPF